MKKIIYTSILLFAVSGLFTNCSFLEEKSQDEVIPKTAQDLSELLLGTGYPWGNDNFFPYIYLMDDDCSINYDIPTLPTNTSVALLYRAYTWQPDMADVSPTAVGLNGSTNSYTSFYNRIKGCNAVLDLIDNISGLQEKIDMIKAEALTIRAWHYFHLVNLYGEPYSVNKESLAVPLKLTASIVENSIRRNTVSEVYNQIESDLKRAIDLFSKYNVTRGDFHINLPSAYIILSRVYLYMGKWDDCVEASTNAIKFGGKLADMTQNTTWTPIATYNFSETEWIYGKAECNYYMGTNLNFKPSAELLSLYDQENDARFKTFFLYTSTSIVVDSKTIKIYGYIMNKNDKTTSAALGNSLRVAEAYMNRAEAYSHLGNSKAVEDINTIRQKRIKNYQPVTSITLQNILEERRRELCFETPRWFDLRRNGMPTITHEWKSDVGGTSLIYTLKQGDPMYTLPIPGVVLEHNSALEQNISASSGVRVGAATI